MTKIEVAILGKKWTVRVLKKSKYKRQNGSDSVAITYTDKRRIDLGPKGVDIKTIKHELFHAYYSAMCMGSTDFDEDNHEEHYAEFFAEYAEDIIENAYNIKAQIEWTKGNK